MMVLDLENNILSGLLLVVAVLFLFMGVRNALFVGLAIPMSMLISFAVLSLMGVTLNMVVLFSLILALGMLVDNGIVIVENIFRHRQLGADAESAAIVGATEVAVAVSASTLTTLCAFGPMLFWPGIIGEFMSYLPLTLIVTLSSSLFVALIINPAVCAALMTVKDSYSASKAVDWTLVRYRKVLELALNRPWRAMATGHGVPGLRHRHLRPVQSWCGVLPQDRARQGVREYRGAVRHRPGHVRSTGADLRAAAGWRGRRGELRHRCRHRRATSEPGDDRLRQG